MPAWEITIRNRTSFQIKVWVVVRMGNDLGEAPAGPSSFDNDMGQNTRPVE